jgi:hypothetical protein
MRSKSEMKGRHCPVFNVEREGNNNFISLTWEAFHFGVFCLTGTEKH